ncbi:MAG: ATP-binding protein [Kiloniellaceae bacterium]
MSAKQASHPARRGPFERIGKFTISGQLSAVVAVGVGIGFLIVTALQIERSHASLYAIELHHNVRTTELIAAQLYGAVHWRKPTVIDQSYDRLMDQDDLNLVTAVALDHHGKVLSIYQKDPAEPVDLMALLPDGKAVPLDQKTTSTRIGDLFIVVAPVLSHDGSIRAGTFAMAWDLADFNDLATKAEVRDAIVALATLVVFISLALVFVNRRLSKPLAEVTEATNRIANGDKSFEIPWTGRRDEIGDMARSLVTFRQNVALIDRLTAEQQQQTLRLSEALEKEREYNALHRDFVTMVSHEFRTPVAIIDGAAQRIERRIGKDTPEELQLRTEKIRSAVARMIELIDSTLSVSRMEAGAIELELAECDLAALLKDVCQRQQGIARQHKVRLTIADLPPMMSVDAKRMDQVFTNLLSNAVKYAPDAPQIEVKAGTIGSDVVVAVRDFGVGIPKDELHKLFEKFYRASTSTGIPGTGIGLHLVKFLVELHDGTVAVDSTEGQGTTFSVTFPIRESGAQADDPADEGGFAAMSA